MLCGFRTYSLNCKYKSSSWPMGIYRRWIKKSILFLIIYWEHSTLKLFLYFSLDEEREHFRRDTERQALFQLEKAKTKPVVFAVKTNVAFDGSLDDDSPVHGSAVSFGIGDYLHVMERYDPNWWIGRKVQQDCVIGFIPSPAKLENLRLQVGEKCKIVRGTFLQKLWKWRCIISLSGSISAGTEQRN